MHFLRTWSNVRWAPALLLVLAGCAGSDASHDATVQGTVTIDDELAQGGMVMFHSVNGPPAVGSIAKDGSYALRIGRGNASDPDYSGIPSGEYVATVSITGPSEENERVAEGGPPSAGARLMADKYHDKKTSDLKFTVKEGANIIVLKLDGPWANPPVEEVSEDEPSEEEGAPAEPAQVEGTNEPGADESAPAASGQATAQDAAPEDPSTSAANAEIAAPDGEQQPSAEDQPQ